MEKYKEEFESLKKYLISELGLDVQCITYFGSYAFDEKSFDANLSDIDILVYCKNFNRANAENYIKKIVGNGKNFDDKFPIFLEDFISARIEFAYKVNGIKFDINVFPTFMKGIENMHESVLHDSIDLIVGAMYLNAKVIYGSHPLKDIIDKKFLPFYSENLRKQRIIVLMNRITKMLEMIKTRSNESDTLFYVYKCRNYLIKLIYIYLKKYPIDEGKHIEMMLRELKVEEKNILILTLKTNDKSNFVNLGNKIIEYIKEGIKNEI